MRKLILAALTVTMVMPSLAAPAAAAPAPQHRYNDRHDDRHDRRYDRRDDRRDDRRYDRNHRWGQDDWRHYRNTNRGLYSRGQWRAPFRYQAFRPGVRINRVYFGPRYLIADPWRYRLPLVQGYLRYVRHYDDVLLVDIRTGRVIRVYNNFYW